LDLAKLLLQGKSGGAARAKKYLRMAARSRFVTSAGREEARKLFDELDRR
jgi:hypothetical protein